MPTAAWSTTRTSARSCCAGSAADRDQPTAQLADGVETTLRTGDLGVLADHPVLVVDEHDGRLPALGGGGLDLGAGRDDDLVAGLGQVGGCAVDADDAAIDISAQRVRHQAGSAGDVPDVHLLVLQDPGGFEELA